mmetsp:Transcript_27543/g.66969  ORF Transcript_27543/g.66969 Transcript_27543/m.66969 type:complete len:333 (-) Transcript_27543:92-1090(-)
MTSAAATAATSLTAVFSETNGTSIQIGILQFTNGSGGLLGFLVDHHSTSIGSAFLVGQDCGIVHVTSLAHVVLETSPVRLVAQVPYVHRGVSACSRILLVSASSAVTTSTCTCRGSFTIFTNKNHASLQFSLSQSFNGLLSFFSSGVLDDTTSLGSSIMLANNFSMNHITNRLHVILKLLPLDFPTKVTNINSSSLCLIIRRELGSSSTTIRSSAARSRSSSTLFFTILADKDLTSLEFCVIQCEHGLFGTFHSSKFHNSTSLGSSITCLHDVSSGNVVSHSLEEILKVSPIDLPGQVSNIDSLGFASVWSCSFTTTSSFWSGLFRLGHFLC